MKEGSWFNQLGNWSKSYLQDRVQHTAFSGELSNPDDVMVGVPQGSILGALLFILYINDLPSVVSKAKVILYACNTALMYSGTSVAEIELIIKGELSKVGSWLNSNKLTLNAFKTKHMVIIPKAKLSQTTETIQLRVGNSNLTRVVEYKYLKVWFDPTLSWENHIDKMSKKVASKIALLW